MSIKNVSAVIALAGCAFSVASLVSIINRPSLSLPVETASVSKQVETAADYRLPVVFAELGTGNCVAAFRRGTDSDWNGITGVSCLAVASERKNHQVIERVVPKGTKFEQILEQFLYNDPWKDEYIALESS